MKIAVFKERITGEQRVAITPEIVERITSLGIEICIESEAGSASLFSDDDYKDKGAKIIKSPQAVAKDANIVFCVNSPSQKLNTKSKLYEILPHGTTIIGMLDPHKNEGDLEKFSECKFSTLSLELLPRISRAQSMDVLSSQSNISGYKAVIDAIAELNKVVPMMMTAAGTIKPANVLILGAGVAGLQAIATAKRMGAVVSAFDVRQEAKEQVESLGAKFIEVKDDNAEEKAVYAKEMDDEYKKRQQALIEKALSESDIIITTALIPGRKAPILITSNMLAVCKKGSVVVDLAAINGGNVEGVVVNKTTDINGVKIIGDANLTSKVSNDSSSLYARNLFNLFELLWDKENKTVKIDTKDEIIENSLLTHKGAVVHKLFKKKLESGKKKETPTSVKKNTSSTPKKILDRKPHLKKVETTKVKPQKRT